MFFFNLPWQKNPRAIRCAIWSHYISLLLDPAPIVSTFVQLNTEAYNFSKFYHRVYITPPITNCCNAAVFTVFTDRDHSDPYLLISHIGTLTSPPGFGPSAEKISLNKRLKWLYLRDDVTVKAVLPLEAQQNQKKGEGDAHTVLRRGLVRQHTLTLDMQGSIYRLSDSHYKWVSISDHFRQPGSD